jgi:putative oxidoreductase
MGIDRLRHPGWGIALIRVAMGAMLLYSGLIKLPALQGATGFFNAMGIPAPQILAPVIAVGEVLGGLLLIVGLGIRYVPWWFIAMFLVTTFYVKLPREAPVFGYDAARIDIMLLLISVMLLLEGAGAFALDTYLARRRTTAEVQPQAARA